MLARLSLAWLAAMQVMMFAFPGYLREYETNLDNRLMLDQAVFIMNWISFALTMPVMVYCAWPIWGGALRRMLQGGVSMDVPVALGIAAAFLPSAYATMIGYGEVYFESVCMFVAFLLTARYLEYSARVTSGLAGRHPVLAGLRERLSASANKVAFWFVVIQLALAVAVGLAWYVLDPAHALPVTVALFVMSCPCAMSMSVPTALAASDAALLRRESPSDAEVEAVARAGQRVARQNLYGSIAWHLLMTPLAAIGLVQPWLATVSMLVSSLAVAANAWWLYRQLISQDGEGGLQAVAA
ncbi:E1-E2 ATPase [Paracandidimonas soli]|uniref:E1-E2 ATPase n=2 Tax=Paracandidimonas soli TaxID=1917182 RepID=A0A4R3V8F7_9BURK|nr:E1-E2 ATPase [Paracandidimonas soli]